jgi:hypothetical protein
MAMLSLGSVAEWSKALVLGTSLLGGVGSNPTAATSFFLTFLIESVGIGDVFFCTVASALSNTVLE